jgi:hypothetical protein
VEGDQAYPECRLIMEAKQKALRKWVLASVIAVLATVAVACGFAASHRGPYAFLERWLPQHVEVDYAKLYPGAKSAKGRPPPRSEALIFDQRYSGEILTALKSRLHSRGFIEINIGANLRKHSSNPPELRESEFWFFHQTTPRGGVGEVVDFESGVMGGYAANRYRRVPTALPADTPPACVIVVRAEDTWFDRQLRAIRSFLHIG